MLVVADTTPLRYLVEIGYEYLLPRLFTRVWIPGTVASELRHEGAPDVVRKWAAQIPSWVEVREVVAGPPFAHELSGLDRGEWEAIQLAQEIKANLLLIDERFRRPHPPRAGVRCYRYARRFGRGGSIKSHRHQRGAGTSGKNDFRRTPDLFAQTQDLVRKSRKNAWGE